MGAGKWWTAGLAVASAGAIGTSGAAAAVPSGGCVADAGTTTCAFTFTGAPEPFVVPSGVSTAEVVLRGAQGGQVTYNGAPLDAARGAQLHAAVGGLVPGEQLMFVLGGRGSDDRCRQEAAGGFNGGGRGGPGGNFADCGAGGGGASDVRRGGTGPADRVLVAGGGGGAGGIGTAGAPGGSSGSAGTASSQLGWPVAAPGQPGTGTAGGAGGAATCPTEQSGAAGTAGVGGAGGASSDPNTGLGGGGGGGGWHGGGGGAAANRDDCRMSQTGAGGGGGGSSHVGAGASLLSLAEGQRLGTGSATISFPTPERGPNTTIATAPASGGGWTRATAVRVTATSETGATALRCVLDPSAPPASFAATPAGCAYGGAGADVTAEGAHVLHAASSDDTGTGGAVEQVTIRIDRSAPSITCPSPAPVFAQNREATVTATVTDALSGPTAPTASAPADVATTGDKTVALQGTDVAGNTATVRCAYRVAAPPVASIEATGTPGDDGWLRSAATVVVSAAGDSTAVRCALDPEPAPAEFEDLPAEPCPYRGAGGTIGEGVHVVAAAARSEVSGPVRRREVKVDTTAPAVACETPVPVFKTGATGAVVRATVSDATSGPAGASTSAPADTSAAGDRKAAVTGTDVAGNTATVECAYRVAAPPVAPIEEAGTLGDSAVAPPPIFCRGLEVTLLDLQTRGRRVVVSGLARSTNAGKPVVIRQNGRRLATTTVGADGTFAAAVKSPRNRRSASYTATVGTETTRPMRLVRRLTIETRTGRRYTFRVAAKRTQVPRKVTIVRQVTCGTRSRVGTVKVSRSGRFRVRFARPARDVVAIYRIIAPLRGGATYSIFVAVRG